MKLKDVLKIRGIDCFEVYLHHSPFDSIKNWNDYMDYYVFDANFSIDTLFVEICKDSPEVVRALEESED